MKDNIFYSKEIKKLKRFFLIVAIVLPAFIMASFVWNTHYEMKHISQSAEDVALAIYKQAIDNITSIASYGGTYVAITEKNAPNPFLANVEDCDITTVSGKKLTLMHPSFILHNSSAATDAISETKIRFISLNSLDPEHKADEWETKALKNFEAGKELYINSIEIINHEEYFRSIQRLQVKKSCLKCHSQQGYKEGDVRGGISISVPMKKNNEIAKVKVINSLLLHAGTSILFILLSVFGYRQLKAGILSRQQSHRIIAESENNLRTQNEEYLALNEDLNEKNEEYAALTEEYCSQNDDLKKARDKAEESDRLKSAFLANISHEIRTPMNSIVGFSELLVRAELHEDRKIMYAKIINESCLDLLKIMNDLIDISKIESGLMDLNKTQFSLNKLFGHLKDLFSTDAEQKGLALNCTKGVVDNECDIFSDNIKIKQILTNLISNAIKYTDHGSVEIGYILLQTHNATQKNEVELYVKDTGIGIPKEKHNDVFKRFVQLKDNSDKPRTGAGLGLSITEGFVKLLGGTIWFTSEINKGTEFHVVIPIIFMDKRI